MGIFLCILVLEVVNSLTPTHIPTRDQDILGIRIQDLLVTPTCTHANGMFNVLNEYTLVLVLVLGGGQDKDKDKDKG